MSRRSGATDDTRVDGARGLRSPSGIFAAGTAVDHFRITRLLGKGGMGKVYLAKDEKLGRNVALKMVQREMLGVDEAAVRRFLFEARATAKFNHPNIVTLYEAGEHAGTPYVALEYVQGQTLRERMRAGPISVVEALDIGIAIADALSEAHGHGIVHRDLKPPNVMLSQDGRVRVLDFGLAKRLTPTDRDGGETYASALHNSPDQRGMAGTPAYMAPEQWRGEEAGGATDVWALGLILFEMLSGERPFRCGDVVEHAAAVCSPEPAPSLSHAQVPDKLALLVERCLDKDDARRPEARQLGVRLRAIRQAQTGKSTPLRGLDPLERIDHELLVGRSDALQSLMKRLEGEPLVMVTGASGCGKTSFLRAGVLPILEASDGWLTITVPAGARALSALAEAIVAERSTRQREARTGEPTALSTTRSAPSDALDDVTTQVDGTRTDAMRTGQRAELADALRQERKLAGAELPNDVALRLAQDPHALHDALMHLANSRERTVLLCVDQLDDVVLRRATDPNAAALLRSLSCAAFDEREPVRVLIGMNRQPEALFDGEPRRHAAQARALELTAPTRDALRDIIARSIKHAGVQLEDRALVDELLRFVADSPAAVSLVQLALQQLWEERDDEREPLSLASWRERGGLEGMLAEHAQAVHDAFTPHEKGLARRILLGLVGPAGSLRQVPMDELVDPHDAPQVAVFVALVNARLVASGSAGTWTLAHASLATRWETLARWINTYAEQLAALDRAIRAADVWSRRGRTDAFLGAPALVSDAEQAAAALLPRPSVTLGDFLDASRRYVRQRAARRRVAVAIVSLLAVAAGGVAFGMRSAPDQRETTQAIEEPRPEPAPSTAKPEPDPIPAATASAKPAPDPTAAPASSPVEAPKPSPRPRVRPTPHQRSRVVRFAHY